ncbi:RDD family protein [compost metagenome]
METIKINTSQHVEIDYPVAGLGERVAAYLLDLVLFSFIYFFAIIALAIIGIQGSFQNSTVVVLIIIFAVCYVFYDLLCEVAFNGQSLGKKLLKIKVVSLDGGQASIGQYFIRWVFRIADFTLTGNLLGFISVAVSQKKQRIGDLVAGTTLIRTVPATKIEHIAFHPVEDEEYTPSFPNVVMLSDQDIELVHEVVRTYYTTYNTQLIYQMAAKVASHLAITIPEGMNEMQFLKTISSDYIYLTSRAV